MVTTGTSETASVHLIATPGNKCVSPPPFKPFFRNINDSCSNSQPDRTGTVSVVLVGTGTPFIAELIKAHGLAWPVNR